MGTWPRSLNYLVGYLQPCKNIELPIISYAECWLMVYCDSSDFLVLNKINVVMCDHVKFRKQMCIKLNYINYKIGYMYSVMQNDFKIHIYKMK